MLTLPFLTKIQIVNSVCNKNKNENFLYFYVIVSWNKIVTAGLRGVLLYSWTKQNGNINTSERVGESGNDCVSFPTCDAATTVYFYNFFELPLIVANRSNYISWNIFMFSLFVCILSTLQYIAMWNAKKNYDYTTINDKNELSLLLEISC